MKTVLRSLATANPPRYETQQEIYRILMSLFEMGPAEKDLDARLLLDGQVKGRYIAVPRNEEALETSFDALTERFRVHGLDMAACAARKALEQASLRPADVRGLIVNTCTGYLCPGLSSYVAEALGLEPFIKVADLMGMGCGAAVPNLECAAGMLARGAGGPILSIAVEVCTATLFMGPHPDLIVSNCLFGDGAAAMVVDVAEGDGKAGLATLVDFETGLFPRYREDLRYRTEDGRLRNVLSRQVPVIGAWTAGEVAKRLLERHGLAPNDVDWWAVHPGGTAVLDQAGKRLGLPRERLRFSYEVFHDYGNMSSPSVAFVLERILGEGRPKPGQRGMLLTFGAGFSAYAALVEF